MRFTDFRDQILATLRRHPEGLTWKELKTQLRLPYCQPCPNWTRRLEAEGLERVPGPGRALIWRLSEPER